MPNAKKDERRRAQWLRQQKEHREKKAARPPAPGKPSTIVNGKVLPHE